MISIWEKDGQGLLCSCVTAPVLLDFYPFYREKGLTFFLSGSITEQGIIIPLKSRNTKRSNPRTLQGKECHYGQFRQSWSIMERRHMDDMECNSYTPEGTVAFLCAISISFPFAIAEKTG